MKLFLTVLLVFKCSIFLHAENSFDEVRQNCFHFYSKSPNYLDCLRRNQISPDKNEIIESCTQNIQGINQLHCLQSEKIDIPDVLIKLKCYEVYQNTPNAHNCIQEFSNSLIK